MSEKQDPPLHLPKTDNQGEQGYIELDTTYIGKQPKPGSKSQGGGFRIPPTRPGGMGSGITNTEGLRRETRDKIKAAEQSFKAAYEAKSVNLPATTETELSSARAQYPAAVSTAAQAYKHELNIRNLLIQQKTVELHTETVLANDFYGHSPLNTSIGNYLARAQTLDKTVTPYGPAYSKWVVSYKAAYSAKLLTEQIQLLSNQYGHVQNLLTTAQAQEQRAAAEQAQLAAAQEAQRTATEQARLAAEQEAQRIAAEQAQLAAEQEALRVTAEQARLDAEVQRQAEEKALREAMEAANAAKDVRPFSVSGTAASGPAFAVATGTLAVDAATTLAIRTALRSAAAAAITASAAAVGTATGVLIVVGVAALVYQALKDKEPYAFSFPLSDLTTFDDNELLAIGDANGDVDLSVAMGSRTAESITEFVVAAANGTTVPGKVPVRLATYDPNLNVYSAPHPDAPGAGMIWTPIVGPDNPSTTLPVEQPDIGLYTGAIASALEGRIDQHPEMDLLNFGGVIYVFPSESGIPPQYVMFRDRRDEPGAATGFGEALSGVWLGSATQGEGAKIPTQIADQLRGREFTNFRAFREALWKAAGTDPELAKQFRVHNVKAMMNGKAPTAREDGHLGLKIKFELHHIELISEGGAVFDIDNIKVVTPKRHSELHKKVISNE